MNETAPPAPARRYALLECGCIRKYAPPEGSMFLCRQHGATRGTFKRADEWKALAQPHLEVCPDQCGNRFSFGCDYGIGVAEAYYAEVDRDKLIAAQAAP